MSGIVTKKRDVRLDLWRGACLVDMVAVHAVEVAHLSVPGPLYTWLIWYTKFAAGGFILVSGLCIGAIYGRKLATPADQRATYSRLVKRAGFVYLAHVAMVLLYDAATATEAVAVGAYTPAEPLARLWGAVTLRHWGGFDLLPFYVVMLLLAPLMLALLRRRLGWALLLVSAGVFAADVWRPGWGDLPLTAGFSPPRWQALFVGGAVLGWSMPAYDRLSIGRGKLAVLGGFVAAALLISGWKFAGDLGLPAAGGGWWPFAKVPLGWAEVLRYVAVSGAIFLAIEQLLRAGWFETLMTPVTQMGRHALPVFVVHMLIVGAVVRALDAWPAILIATALVWAFAALTELAQRRFIQTRFWSAPATLVLSAVTLAVLYLTR